MNQDRLEGVKERQGPAAVLVGGGVGGATAWMERRRVASEYIAGRDARLQTAKAGRLK